MMDLSVEERKGVVETYEMRRVEKKRLLVDLYSIVLLRRKLQMVAD